jgi:hypothetical protein
MSHSVIGRLFSDDGYVVRVARSTGGLVAGQERPLAAIALDHDALGMPPVDPAEAHLLSLVASFGVSDYLRHPPPFPVGDAPRFRQCHLQQPQTLPVVRPTSSTNLRCKRRQGRYTPAGWSVKKSRAGLELGGGIICASPGNDLFLYPHDRNNKRRKTGASKRRTLGR